MIQGGCFCKQTRFAIADGDYRVVNCHCTMCRRTSAAPFVTWIVVPKSAFEFSGAPPKALRSSEKGARHFCPNCGTPLTFTDTDRPGEVDVTVCSLDNPQDFPPSKAVCEDTKLPWLKETE
jgi:hypothetical protein